MDMPAFSWWNGGKHRDIRLRFVVLLRDDFSPRGCSKHLRKFAAFLHKVSTFVWAKKIGGRRNRPPSFFGRLWRRLASNAVHWGRFTLDFVGRRMR
jgi:hypothetical protein